MGSYTGAYGVSRARIDGSPEATIAPGSSVSTARAMAPPARGTTPACRRGPRRARWASTWAHTHAHPAVSQVPEMAQGHCPYRCGACGAVRIGTGVCVRLEPGVQTPDIVYGRALDVKQNHNRSLRFTLTYPTAREGMTNFLASEGVPFSTQVAPPWRCLFSYIPRRACEIPIQRRHPPLVSPRHQFMALPRFW
jgi:hypothetical protein